MDLRQIAWTYYQRKDIQEAIAFHSKGREVVPRYLDSFGKRPDMVEYAGDVANLAEKGATSFHFSEELWNNPLDLGTSMTPEQMNSLRKGWDLILDVDSKYLEYSKVAAELIIGALKFHSVKNIGLKFSGRGGWHIIVPFESFPDEVHGIKIKDLFPQGPRMVSQYLRELIEGSLRDRLRDIVDIKELSARMNKPEEDFYINNIFNPFSVVDIDSVAISPRHLIRMPYSINEKSGLVSIVIRPDQIREFNIGWAKPERVIPQSFFPKVEKGEARELIIQAFDWHKIQEGKAGKSIITSPQNANKNTTLNVKDSTPDMWPPCIMNALNGIQGDGRKRCLFIMLNFFRSINMSNEEVKNKILEWNNKNAQPLKEGYVTAQLNWHFRNKAMLPPNCDKIQKMYADLGICRPDNFCSRIKNPGHYTSRQYQMKTRPAQGTGNGAGPQKKKRKSTAKETGPTREFRGRF